MKNNITDKVLNKIKDTKPKSRFAFLVKNYAFWVAGILSILVGAITVSVMIFVLTSHEWSLAGRAGGMFKSLFYILPYFWIAVFILFVIIAFYEIKKTDSGYKVTLPIVIIVYLVSTVFLGFGFFKVGVGDRVEETFVEHAPLYNHLVEPRQKLFQKPEDGILIGRVLNISKEELILLDLEEEEWDIDIEEAHIPPHIQIEFLQDKMIVIIGEDKGGHEFEAEGIRPHKLPGKRPVMRKVRGVKEMRQDMRIIE